MNLRVQTVVSLLTSVLLCGSALSKGEKSKSQKAKLHQTVPVLRLSNIREVRDILQAVITDVLTNPKLTDTRKKYGSPKQPTVALFDSEQVGWPRKFKPTTHGYKLLKIRDDSAVTHRPALGLRLERFEYKNRNPEGGDAPIIVSLFSANGYVAGWYMVSYVPKRVAKKWTVEFGGRFPP